MKKERGVNCKNSESMVISKKKEPSRGKNESSIVRSQNLWLLAKGTAQEKKERNIIVRCQNLWFSAKGTADEKKELNINSKMSESMVVKKSKS